MQVRFLRKLRTGSDQRPGELIYLSERKLLNLARALGVSAAWFETQVKLTGGGRVALPVVPGTGLSAQVQAQAKRVDPLQREHSLEQILERVLASLAREGLPDLDTGSATIAEAGWFRFHRQLRFGVGSDNNTRSVKALVLVDRRAVEENSGRPGLLMFGAPAHLRAPYYFEELCNSPGARSGSGNGTLFIWLQEAREALEDDPGADLDALKQTLAGGASEDAPTSMYRLFARDGWMSNPRFPQLVHPGSCEGIAQVSLINAAEQQTVIMASPLYVRVRSLPQARTQQR